MIIEMVDPLGQVIRECGQRELPRKSIALTYAFAIRQDVTADFRAANDAIIARFGIKGLNAIKKLAWKYVDEQSHTVPA